jgi:hypothetical protein
MHGHNRKAMKNENDTIQREYDSIPIEKHKSREQRSRINQQIRDFQNMTPKEIEDYMDEHNLDFDDMSW